MKRLRMRISKVSSAHLIAGAALFVALGSGAYAMSIPNNSIGAAQLQKNAVKEAELAAQAVGQQELQKAAVAAEALAAKAVTEAKLRDEAVAAKKLRDQAVTAQKIADEAVQLKNLAEAARATLFTKYSDATVPITTDTSIATLNLPAGSFLVQASIAATHTGNVASTRLECYVSAGGATIAYAKERLQANAGAEPMIFTSQPLQGVAALPSGGPAELRCTSTNGSTIELTTIRFHALRVQGVQAQ
jgi:hypothetical protein